MRNILTVDVEDWFHTNDFDINKENWSHYESRIEKNTDSILKILDECKVKATFFILGSIAETDPGVVKKIYDAGHDIGSHGSYHEMADKMDIEAFREDVRRSCGMIGDITGKKVINFRAPSWSIGPKNFWALEVLEEEGIKFDSSFQPFKTFLSGNNSLPLQPFHPVINGERLSLIEVPSTIFGFAGLRMPFSGGAYLRILPEAFIVWAFRRVISKRPAMMYLHPWEIDIDQPKLKSSLLFQIAHYRNLDTTERKLRRVLNEFEFGPISEVFKDSEFPDIIIKG